MVAGPNGVYHNQLEMLDQPVDPEVKLVNIVTGRVALWPEIQEGSIEAVRKYGIHEAMRHELGDFAFHMPARNANDALLIGPTS
jgi:hypothetical protein